MRIVLKYMLIKIRMYKKIYNTILLGVLAVASIFLSQALAQTQSVVLSTITNVVVVNQQMPIANKQATSATTEQKKPVKQKEAAQQKKNLQQKKITKNKQVASKKIKKTQSAPQLAMQTDADIVKPTNNFSRAEKYEALPAGALTHHKIINQDAFSFASANMSFEREMDFQIGNAFFTRLWVSPPASTQSSDGLGPLFNARACQHCHLKDGRGHPPENAEGNNVSMLLRLSIPPQNKAQQEQLDKLLVSTIDDPVYGGQLQDVAVQGLAAEGQFTVSYTEMSLKLSGGEVARLRKPSYHIHNLQYGPLHKDAMFSPRIAPQMIGLGLLEAIAEQEVLKQQDIEDKNHDGISGKANRVWSFELQGVALGRFGHKAQAATLTDQNQSAFNHDIGLSTPLFSNAYGDCTPAQSLCYKMPNGADAAFDNLEINQLVVAKVLHYSRNLAVPARRKVDAPEVLAGKKLFYESGCIGCHTPKYITPRETPSIEQSRQLIWPYTDLLLHDMGEGLADNSPAGLATGREWRTAPLWGIGLTPVVNKHSYYLHDGRARNLLEAILWHGGEAQQAQQKVVAMNPQQRQQLLAFIKSL